MLKGAHGVMLVVDTDVESHEAELERWYTAFVRGAGLPPTMAHIFANQTSHLKGEPRQLKPRACK